MEQAFRKHCDPRNNGDISTLVYFSPLIYGTIGKACSQDICGVHTVLYFLIHFLIPFDKKDT